MKEETKHQAFLRRKSVEMRTGLKRSTIYELIQEKSFPRPITIGSRAVGWLESDIDKWICERVAASRKGKDHAK